MRTFWLYMAQRSLRFALKMRTMGKVQRQEWADIVRRAPELAAEPSLEVWRDCFKVARKSLADCREALAKAQAYEAGKEVAA